MLDRTNAERQRRYRARHKTPALSPRQRSLILNAITDKMIMLDGLGRRTGNPDTSAIASEYRVILDTLAATWRTE